MIARLMRLLERVLNIAPEQADKLRNRLLVSVAAGGFILLATAIIAFDSLFPSQTSIARLQVGDIAPQSVYAPQTISYVSQVLTTQRQQAAASAVGPIYDPPNAAIARQRTQLGRQILDYIDNIRRDPYATFDQRVRDIEQIRELQLEPPIIAHIIDLEADIWREVDDQIITVLERVMRDEIRTDDLEELRAGLDRQVSFRLSLSEDDVQVIVAIVGNLLRANTLENQARTEEARVAAVQAVPEQRRGFERGQLVVSAGSRIEALDYEALQALGLLQVVDRRLQEVAAAALASFVVMVIVGLYVLRFQPDLIYSQPRTLTLLAGIFLIALLGARLGLSGQIYIYPAAALALLFVTIIGSEVAIMSVIGLALLVGIMSNNALEIASLVASGGIIGALSLKRAERLNSFFYAGLMVAVVSMAVAIIFNLEVPDAPSRIAFLLLYCLLNGILTAAAAIAGMYIVTFFFNLPTALKLVELSQPNQPLLQRLLREAPGTYQHTLQVANLAEQAANAIGANAELTHTAALYHDIGKMLNPSFFTENQADIGNPHDALNDPYRSANIIISHVTQGDEMARQYRLPERIRDFIREHHGTMTVYVFYKQAVILANDDERSVSLRDFQYPGPKPQSRETAILMLADGCEASVRSRQPKTRQEIEVIINEVIDDRRKSGQLDESGLTLNDLNAIRRIFAEMLQAIFHPRINYTEAIARVRQTLTTPEKTPKVSLDANDHKRTEATGDAARAAGRAAEPAATAIDDDGDSPLTEVPRLRRQVETREMPLNDSPPAPTKPYPD